MGKPALQLVLPTDVRTGPERCVIAGAVCGGLRRKHHVEARAPHVPVADITTAHDKLHAVAGYVKRPVWSMIPMGVAPRRKYRCVLSRT
jgi:hypothetical protein